MLNFEVLTPENLAHETRLITLEADRVVSVTLERYCWAIIQEIQAQSGCRLAELCAAALDIHPDLSPGQALYRFAVDHLRGVQPIVPAAVMALRSTGSRRAH